MPRRMVDIPPPIKGLSDDMAFTDQLPLTTRKALNVRVDAATGRRRIGQRAGLSLFNSSQLSGANKVADIATITKDEDLLTYADDDTSSTSGPSNVFVKALPGPRSTSTEGSGTEKEGDCVDLRMDDFGDLYAAQRVGGVFKYNQDGELLAELLLPEGDATTSRVEISCIDVDEFGNVVVGTGGNSTAVADCRLYFFENRADGTYRLGWTLDTGRAFMDVAFHNGAIYTLEGTDTPDNFTGGAATSSFRVYPDYTLSAAPTEDEDQRCQITSNTGTNVYGTRMAVREDGVAYVSALDNSINCWLLKLNPLGDTPGTPVWKIQGASGADDAGGLAYSVAIGPRNSIGQRTIYSYGPQGSATDTNEVRRIVDKGTAFDLAGTDAWEQSLTAPGTTPETLHFARIDVDIDGHVYVPQVTSMSGAVNIVEIRKASDGSQLNSFEDDSGEEPPNGAICVAVPKGAKPRGSSSEEVEFVFFGTRESSTNFYSFQKQRMLKVSQGTGSMRTLLKLGVANGNIVKFTTSTVTTPTGGSGALDSAARYVMSTDLGEYVYWTDGTSYKRYSVQDDEVSDLLSSTSGTIPPRCKLIETWRGRLVLARDPEDPQLWHMSAVGDATDWDNFPPIAKLTQAISGVNAKAGRVPDIVNALVPWTNDLLLVGGDKAIWRLTGDPLAGGQWDQISLETGMAFGRSWTMDPLGARLFFVGSRGGVYMMERGTLPVRISRDRIERRLQDIDFADYHVRLVWDYRAEGLLVLQIPFGAGGTLIKHWFWDAKNDAWWEDQYGIGTTTDAQPTAALIFDGDEAADRVVAFGCEDGRVRYSDEDAKSDEGASASIAIPAEVVYGPLAPANETYDYRFSHLVGVLARDQNGCNVRCYAQPEADTLGLPKAMTTLQPGRNRGKPVRFRGPNGWISLSNTKAGERFAVEDLQIGIARGARF